MTDRSPRMSEMVAEVDGWRRECASLDADARARVWESYHDDDEDDDE